MTNPPPPYNYPPTYGYNYGSTPMVARTNGTAVAALIFGILGFAIIPVVLGHLALDAIKRTGERGTTVAVIGLVLGYAQIAVYGLGIMLAFWGVSQ